VKIKNDSFFPTLLTPRNKSIIWLHALLFGVIPPNTPLPKLKKAVPSQRKMNRRVLQNHHFPYLLIGPAAALRADRSK
jgi:hypothetical protein